MKNKIRLIAALLALCLLFAQAGCQYDTKDQSEETAPPAAAEITEEPAEPVGEASDEMAEMKKEEAPAKETDSSGTEQNTEDAQNAAENSESTQTDGGEAESDVIVIPDGMEVGGVE